MWDGTGTGVVTKNKHPVYALNARSLSKLTKAGRYADGNGLYLIVDPSGARRWVLRTVMDCPGASGPLEL